jgi:predicted nuclease of predicted toxin-antitoxin system
MIFVVDASVDHPVTLRLRQDGHVAYSIKEIAPRLSDNDVLALANAHDALLITADKDFGDMVVRAGHVSAGVILVRLAGLRAATRADVVASEIAEMADILRGSFTVITPSGIRVRPLSRNRR